VVQPRGLYGIEDAQMNQMNKILKLDMTASDLLSLIAGSMMKVSTGGGILKIEESGKWQNPYFPFWSRANNSAF
jgi:hypothetical protein